METPGGWGQRGGRDERLAGFGQISESETVGRLGNRASQAGRGGRVRALLEIAMGRRRSEPVKVMQQVLGRGTKDILCGGKNIAIHTRGWSAGPCLSDLRVGSVKYSGADNFTSRQ